MSPDCPGLFWLDATGLTHIYKDLGCFGTAIHRELERCGFVAAVVVGFHRFRTYAIASSSHLARAAGPLVLDSLAQEAAFALRVQLGRLDLSPRLVADLELLGIYTVGDLLRLPAGDLRTRFGHEAFVLHQYASENIEVPRKRCVPDEPIWTLFYVEPADSNLERLLFVVKGMVDGLMRRISVRGEAMAELRLTLGLDHAAPKHEPKHEEVIRFAAPTLDCVHVVDLVRLRLGATRFAAKVASILARVEGARVHAQQQLALFHARQRRDLAAAGRVLERLAAAFGCNAVTRARLRAAHLPEARAVWEPTCEVAFPRPRTETCRLDDPPPLMRRVWSSVALPHPPRSNSDPWLGPGHGALRELQGPWRVSGGWWECTVERDYYYAETESGELLWLYYDRPRRKWFLHGAVD